MLVPLRGAWRRSRNDGRTTARFDGPDDGRRDAGRTPGRGGMKKIDLPPEVQARVDRIIDSEIFGPIMRPMPMALIGIAGDEAFIRATNGQTGPVKVGGELGGIKLLQIGINRVLVEADGEKKELTLFDGVGGESLMPKSTNEPSTNAPSTNAPTKKASKRKGRRQRLNQPASFVQTKGDPIMQSTKRRQQNFKFTACAAFALSCGSPLLVFRARPLCPERGHQQHRDQRHPRRVRRQFNRRARQRRAAATNSPRRRLPPIHPRARPMPTARRLKPRNCRRI